MRTIAGLLSVGLLFVSAITSIFAGFIVHPVAGYLAIAGWSFVLSERCAKTLKPEDRGGG